MNVSEDLDEKEPEGAQTVSVHPHGGRCDVSGDVEVGQPQVLAEERW